MKKYWALILSVVLCVCFTGNIFAGSGYRSQWEAFPVIAQNTSYRNYTRVVQRIIRDENTTLRNEIDNNGGVDGSFGPSTKAAVIMFQDIKGCDLQNGIVGEDTWGELSDSIYTDRTVYVENEGNFNAYRTDGWKSNYVIRRATVTGNWWIRTSSYGDGDAGNGVYVIFNYR